jgi:phosphohistidine phosphatase SixA
VPLANWIARQETERDVLLVGHEPNLSQWASWWLGGSGKRLNLRFKKGSAMQLSMKRADRPAQARLEWMLQPRQLRLLDLP